MKRLAYLMALAAFCGVLHAGPCDFKAEGDPRNGLLFTATSQLPGLSVKSALGQLQGLATEGGYQLGNELLQDNSGELSFTQTSNNPALVIWARADASGRISLTMKLARGQKVEPAAVEAEFCSMLGKIKAGKEGETIAAAARGKSGLGRIVEANAVELSQALEKEIKKAVAPATNKGNLSRILIGTGGRATSSEYAELFAPIRAKYTGQRYRIDGKVYWTSVNANVTSVHDMLTRKMELSFDVRRKKGLLGVMEEPGMQAVHYQIKCILAKDQAKYFQTLNEGDSVTLTGTIAQIEQGGLVLVDARRSD